MFFFLFRIFALQQLFLFSRENLRANLARGRPKFIPLRIPYVWPLCCQAHSVCIPRQVMECICRTIVTSEILYFTNLALLYFKLATFVWELLEKHNKCNLWSLKFWLTALWKEICCQNVYTILIPNSNLYLFSTQRRWRLWRNNEMINVARVHWEHCILITLRTEPFLDAMCFFHNIFLTSQYEKPKKSMQQLLPAKLY